jgi:endoglucanase
VRRPARALLLAGSLLLIAALPNAAAAAPAPISVSGNSLVAGGKPVRLLGVNRSGAEYACSDHGKGFGIFQGPVTPASVAAIRSWGSNAVAIMLQEECWLGISGANPAFSGVNYQNAIRAYVDELNAQGMYVVLRLAVGGPGNRLQTGRDPKKDGAEPPLPDADHAPDFWRSVATTFKDNPAVLFHLFDEPHKVSYPCWLSGCVVKDDFYGRFQAAGMQSLLDAVRSTGATQPVIASGTNYAEDFSGWFSSPLIDPLHQLVANVNTFDFSPCKGRCRSGLIPVAASFPVVTGGFGDTSSGRDKRCNHDYSDKWMRFADRLDISYLAWTWDSVKDFGGCGNSALVRSYNGAPTRFGAGILKHLRALAASGQSG